MRKRKNKRYDPNKKQVKEYLLNHYGNVCMVCYQNFDISELQLHHLDKWQYFHITTIDNSSLVCDCCHKQINYLERTDILKYNITNNKIRVYKSNH